MTDEETTAKMTPVRAPTKRRTKWIIGVLVLLAVAAGVFFVLRGQKKEGTARGGKGAMPERKVPVLVDTAQKRDVPIVLEGLGTVTPLATVQVRSQVSGRLMKLSFQEGQPVKKDQIVAELDLRPFKIAVQQAEATLKRDSASLRNARLLLERNLQLKEQQLVPQQTVDDQQTLVDQWLGTTGIDEAALAAAKLNLEFAHVISPVDGIAGIRQIDIGNLVTPQDALGIVTVTQLNPISVVFTVPQDELDRLHAAMGGKSPQVEAWSRDGAKLVATGELTVIDNQVNATTGTLRLRAMFDNGNRALWPNQFVKARLTVEEKKDALVIPAAAIQRGPEGAFVYLAKEDNTAEQRKVEVELITGQTALMKSGVEEGERVIVDGQAQLKPGASIEVRQGRSIAGAQ
ncbi:MAG: efflux RND transporter periplasmic adaptor subunit [Archangium sp.]